MKKIVIIGAGPSGLTAAFELLKKGGYDVTVVEATSDIGGISKTVVHNGNRMDIGGHRFFSKDDSVMEWWSSMMPLQGKPSKDDSMLEKTGKPFAEGGPDPETDDCAMLIRERVSRILYLRKFFDYPISLRPATFANMGFAKTVKAGFGYMKSVFVKRPENSLEDFMINRFGRPLYEMFFRDYTEKVWGVPPEKISASWGAQRIKGLSLRKAIANAITAPFKKGKSQKEKETSLIEQFWYPKLGPGQLWELTADKCRKMGAEIVMNAEVDGFELGSDGTVTRLYYTKDGRRVALDGDVFISSMPIKDLIASFGDVAPKEVCEVADGLVYRDFMTVGLSVERLNLRNKTKIKTVGEIVPDTWIYVQEQDVSVGRLQIFNNWSPYLVKDFGSRVWIGLEYFCNEGDDKWNMSDADFIAFAENELVKLGIIDEGSVKDSVRFRIKKAYPAYFGSYDRFGEVKDWLDTVGNLYCVGRNGQHRYNNMDHSMLTAFAAVNAIENGGEGKNGIWNVNVEESYHETKK